MRQKDDSSLLDKIAKSEELCKENRIDNVAEDFPQRNYDVYRLKAKLNQCKDCRCYSNPSHDGYYCLVKRVTDEE